MRMAVPSLMENALDSLPEHDEMPAAAAEPAVPEASTLSTAADLHLLLAPPALVSVPLVLPEGVLDIDAPDAEAPEFAVEFVADIYEYMHAKEKEYHVLPAYLETGIFTAEMRTILLEWLIQIHHRLPLAQETLYLAAIVLDRYMSVKAVPHDKIQVAARMYTHVLVQTARC